MSWLEKLREECARTSQSRVAAAMGYSPTVVNQILSGNYKGDFQAVQKAFEGAFMGATVECPVLGEIGSHRCLEEQRRPFAATNPQRVALFRACRAGCPHSRIGESA